MWPFCKLSELDKRLQSLEADKWQLQFPRINDLIGVVRHAREHEPNAFVVDAFKVERLLYELSKEKSK